MQQAPLQPFDPATLLAACIAVSDGPGGADPPGRLRELSHGDWDRLLELADSQRVAPMLCRRLQDRGLEAEVPAAVLAELRDRLRKSAMGNLAVYASLARMLALLRPRGIPVIVLKGAYLAEAVYRDVALRPMIDIDLLVPVDAVPEVAKILEEDGYRPLEPYTLQVVQAERHHLPRNVKPLNPSYEIHWNLLPPGKPWSVPVDGFWERAMPVHLAGEETLALSPADLLLYLCAHAAYGHQFAYGLRASCDIAETIRRDSGELSWDDIVEGAKTLGWQRGVWAVLTQARELVSAAVPQAALDALQPEGETNDVLGDAREQMFLGGESLRALQPGLAGLQGSEESPGGWRNLFSGPLSRETVAARYLLPPDSKKIYLYYPRRLFYLLMQYGRTVLRLWRREPETTRLMERRVRLNDWLAGS
jgi:hypothetical protein